jgi:hypothetical protein
MAYNIVYNSNGSNSPSTVLPGVNTTTLYIVTVPPAPVLAQAGNTDAASVITSNGENIANVTRKSNPFPPGLTS